MSDLAVTCPYCGRTNELHDGPTPDSQPQHGDVSICWGCRALSLYSDTAFGLTLRRPTDAEADQLSRDPQILTALGAAAESYTPQQASSLRRGGLG